MMSLLGPTHSIRTKIKLLPKMKKTSWHELFVLKWSRTRRKALTGAESLLPWSFLFLVLIANDNKGCWVIQIISCLMDDYQKYSKVVRENPTKQWNTVQRISSHDWIKAIPRHIKPIAARITSSLCNMTLNYVFIFPQKVINKASRIQSFYLFFLCATFVNFLCPCMCGWIIICPLPF